jgi:hypothetical protein
MKTRTPRPHRASRAEPILDVWCGLRRPHRQGRSTQELCIAHLGTLWRVADYEWDEEVAVRASGELERRSVRVDVGLAFVAVQGAPSLGAHRAREPFREWPLDPTHGTAYAGCRYHDLIDIPRDWFVGQTDGFEMWPTRARNATFPTPGQ